MIKISKQNNSLIVEGIDNVFYPNNGDNSYPLNSLIVVTDNSDMATFRSVATNDVLFSGLINNIIINGEAVTKDNIIQKFDAVSNSSTGGGGGSTVDAYTKEESDTKFATKTELTNVQTVANDADTKVDALTTRVESVETEMDGKQNLLVSGTNIKTINSQSILGEGNIEVSGGISEEQAQEIAKIPTLEAELAQKANVSDVPTVQTDSAGTDKNYVYSERDGLNYKGVMSKLVVFTNNAENVTLAYNLWGSGARYLVGLPTATATKAGVMSAADKTKLDSVPENIPTQTEVDNIASNVSALQTAMDGKQPTLVSGTNIKTINNESVLGEGNIEVAKKSDIPSIDNLATKDELNNKQDTLVSGTNIKTVNSQSILGEGNIEVSGGISEEQAQEIAKIPTLETELAQKANVSDVPTVQTSGAGTNKNYIYSDTNSTYTGVISRITPNRYTNKIDMRLYFWSPDSANPSYVDTTLYGAATNVAGVMSAADKTKLDSISNEWTGTQSEFDALTTKDNNTIYYVTE